jgi:hypothetical protein
MRRLCVLAFVLLLGFGCAADGDKGSWDEVFKDLRGDNMQMRNNFGGGSDSSATTRSHD